MVIEGLREEDVRKSWEKCGPSVEGIRRNRAAAQNGRVFPKSRKKIHWRLELENTSRPVAGELFHQFTGLITTTRGHLFKIYFVGTAEGVNKSALCDRCHLTPRMSVGAPKDPLAPAIFHSIMGASGFAKSARNQSEGIGMDNFLS